MKKAFYVVLMLFLSVLQLCGQEFLTSPDYIYSHAIAFTESEADSLALLSFAKTVRVVVKNVSHNRVFEDAEGITKTYSNDVKVISGVDVSGIKKFSQYDSGVYIVYYYLNKKAYIEECLEKYNKNWEIASKYKAMDNEQQMHCKNLMLGYYYLAYEAISSDLFSILYPEAKYLKEQTLKTIENSYNSMGYYLSISLRFNGKRLLVRDENGATLPGFEYLTLADEWQEPKYFWDNNARPCNDIKFAKWAYIKNGKLQHQEYRFLYEILVNGELLKLQVPEKFYYLNGFTRKFHF